MVEIEHESTKVSGIRRIYLIQNLSRNARPYLKFATCNESLQLQALTSASLKFGPH